MTGANYLWEMFSAFDTKHTKKSSMLHWCRTSCNEVLPILSPTPSPNCSFYQPAMFLSAYFILLHSQVNKTPSEWWFFFDGKGGGGLSYRIVQLANGLERWYKHVVSLSSATYMTYILSVTVSNNQSVIHEGKFWITGKWKQSNQFAIFGYQENESNQINLAWKNKTFRDGWHLYLTLQCCHQTILHHDVPLLKKTFRDSLPQQQWTLL